MAWDARDVLRNGLPDPPATPVPGREFAVAKHDNVAVGAVLWLRLWRNGQWDSDAEIVRRGDDGWEPSGSSGGGGWIDPYQRPTRGWDGNSLLQMGTHWYSENGQSAVAVIGMVAKCVSAIEYKTESDRSVYPIESALGAYVIVVEGDREPTLTPLSADLGRIDG